MRPLSRESIDRFHGASMRTTARVHGQRRRRPLFSFISRPGSISAVRPRLDGLDLRWMTLTPRRYRAAECLPGSRWREMIVKMRRREAVTWARTFRAIAGNDYACIAFAPSSGKTMVGGHVVTAGIFVGWLAGVSHVDRSTNGGASFSAMTSGPATVQGICCSSDGVVYACDAGGTTTNAWKFQSASWAHFTS